MAAGNTYVALATNTLSSATASVTFSAISGAYTDLVLVVNYGFNTGQYIQLQMNGDTTLANYSGTWLAGNGTNALSGRYTSSSNWISMVDADANLNTISKFDIMNYSNATTYKTVLARSNRAAVWSAAQVGLWRNTAAITSILVKESSGYNFVSGTTFQPFGIAAA